jgi:CubicO group peptidase (beta-lactamase class C family)
MIERANNMTLEQYMQKYIMAPLGLQDITFHIANHPSMLSRYVAMATREGGENLFGTPANPTGAVVYSEDKVWTPDQPDDCGGIGAYASMADYQAILHSITTSDEKLLSPAMNDELFREQLSDAQIAGVQAMFQVDEIRSIMAPGLPKETQANYALGGMIVKGDVAGRRRKGTMHWGGMPNLYWWADREAGVSGIYGSQLVPTGDTQSAEIFTEFEKAVYAEIEGL